MEKKENVRGLTDPIIDIPTIKEFSKGIEALVEQENSLVEKIKDANKSIKSIIDCIDTIAHIKSQERFNSIRFFDSSDSYEYKNFYGIDHNVLCQMLDVFKLSCEKDLAAKKKELEDLIARCSSKLQETSVNEEL